MLAEPTEGIGSAPSGRGLRERPRQGASTWCIRDPLASQVLLELLEEEGFTLGGGGGGGAAFDVVLRNGCCTRRPCMATKIRKKKTA